MSSYKSTIEQTNFINNSYKQKEFSKKNYYNNYLYPFNNNQKFQQLADIIYYYNIRKTDINSKNEYILRKSWFEDWKSSIKYNKIENEYNKPKILNHLRKENISCSFRLNQIHDEILNNKFFDNNEFVKIDKYLCEQFKILYKSFGNEVINMNQIICIELSDSLIYYKNNRFNFNDCQSKYEIEQIIKDLSKDIQNFFTFNNQNAQKLFDLTESSL